MIVIKYHALVTIYNENAPIYLLIDGQPFSIYTYPQFILRILFPTLTFSKMYNTSVLFYCDSEDIFSRANNSMLYSENEPPFDKTNKVACAPSEDSDQPGYPLSLIRVFAVRMKKAWVLSYPLNAQRRLCSDWAYAPSDLSLRWAHMPLCWFCHEVAQMSFLKTRKYVCQKVAIKP